MPNQSDPHLTPQPVGPGVLIKGLAATTTIVFLALAIVATISVVALVIEGIHNSAAKDKATHALTVAVDNEQRLHTQIVQGCIRANIATARSNVNDQADYNVYVFVGATTMVPPKGTAREKRLTRIFKRQLMAVIATKTWTPLTNCSDVVAHSGASYKAPLPIPFSKQQPPESALDYLVNATRKTPVGSLP